MKTKSIFFKHCSAITSFAGILLGLAIGGCGNVNVDPLDLMNNSIPQLNSITPNSGAYTSYILGSFTPSTPYWVFSNNFAAFGQNYTAPAAGLISEIGTASIAGVQGYFVTLIHSGRLSTRLYGLQQPSLVRSGDYVVAGQVIAQYNNLVSTPVAFQVLLDGVPVCPLSYLSTQFRTSFAAYGTQMCQ